MMAINLSIFTVLSIKKLDFMRFIIIFFTPIALFAGYLI
jgi:hypothetical protein